MTKIKPIAIIVIGVLASVFSYNNFQTGNRIFGSLSAAIAALCLPLGFHLLTKKGKYYSKQSLLGVDGFDAFLDIDNKVKLKLFEWENNSVTLTYNPVITGRHDFYASKIEANIPSGEIFHSGGPRAHVDYIKTTSGKNYTFARRTPKYKFDVTGSIYIVHMTEIASEAPKLNQPLPKKNYAKFVIYEK